MSKSQKSVESTPNVNVVRVHLRLYNGTTRKNDVELPASLPQFSAIVSEVVERNDRVHRNEISREQMNGLIDRLYREREKVRTKNEIALAAFDHLIKVVCGIRKYRQIVPTARIAVEAWPRS